jgi:hypothetical protein
MRGGRVERQNYKVQSLNLNKYKIQMFHTLTTRHGDFYH